MPTQEIVKKLTPQEEALALAIDGSLVAQDLIQSFNEFCTQLDASCKETTNGTSNKLKHLQAKIDYKLKIIAALQSLGLLPRDLGSMTRTEFIFKAHAGQNGAVNTKSVSGAELKEIQEKERSEQVYESEEDKAIVAALEAEYTRADN
jgi:hypothetical protein